MVLADVKPWEILAEVVKLCTYPPPQNPLAVDWEYFDRLPLQERVIAQGALINVLHKVIEGQQQDKYYTAKGRFRDGKEMGDVYDKVFFKQLTMILLILS